MKRRGLATDPYYSFDRFMSLAERHGLGASFFFITRYRNTDGTPLSRYRMTDPGAVGLIEGPAGEATRSGSIRATTRF